MAKIADAEEDRPARVSPPRAHQLAAGEGWSVADVVCTAGPADRPFEERHLQTSIAVVLSGTFQYRSSTGCELMTPGSLLLGNAGEGFCCGHEHGTGDRCLAVWYAPGFFEHVSADAAGVRALGARSRFPVPRLPSLRALSPLVATAGTFLATHVSHSACEEWALALAGRAAQMASGVPLRHSGARPSALARVTRVVRMIEHEPGLSTGLANLARVARLSPYHFLRTFEEVTGVTPHQYLMRLRLRNAATRLRRDTSRVLDIALDCGFGDVSNFNRAFRTEFGVSPTRYRQRADR